MSYVKFAIIIFPQARKRPRSPAPEANDGLAKAKFCSEMADAKNAPASGVMKCVVHKEKRSQILLNTSSPGIALTLPERNSERRRLATIAHLLSMSNAGGFRLLRMESTTIALSSTGREIASAIKSFVFKLVRLRVLF